MILLSKAGKIAKFTLKTIEKLVNICIQDVILSQKSLNRYQYVY